MILPQSYIDIVDTSRSYKRVLDKFITILGELISILDWLFLLVSVVDG
jgi:hypothetical protein